MGERFVLQLRESFEQNGILAALPKTYRVVEESDELASLGISWLACPGHSQSDLVYVAGDFAVTGDVLLRNIFQVPLLDIDLDTFEGRFRNYEAYCGSIIKLAQLSGRRILPGHREYVSGVEESIVSYVTTLLERAVRLLPIRNRAMCDIISHLFKGRQPDPFFAYLKMSEIVFMLDFIEQPSLLRTSLEQIGLFDKVDELFAAIVK